MKQYKLLKEHDSHFELEHAKEGPFIIAKHGLDDDTMGKIRSLYKGGVAHYADGTEDAEGVQPEDAAPFVGGAPMPAPSLEPETAPAPSLGGMQPPAPTEPETEKAPLVGAAPLPSPLEEKPAPEEKLAPKPEMPSYLKTTQAMIQAPGQQMNQAGMGTPQDPMKAYNQAFGAMKAANIGSAQAQAEQMQQSAAAQQELVNKMQALDNTYQTNLKSLNAEQDRLQADVANNKIDPHRMWSNMATGNRVLAGISILLGGLSQGLTGAKSNPAMDVINNAIDRDIDAQKAELGKKQSLLSLNLQKFGRLDAATAATRAQLLGLTQAQISMSAAKSGSAVAMNQAKLANAQLDLQKAQLMQSVAGQQTVQAVLRQPGGVTPDMVTQLPKDIRETLVRAPNGNFYQAVDKEAAIAANKGLTSVASANSLINRAKQFMAEGRAAPGGERSGQADVISEELTLELKTLGGLGVLSGPDMGIVEKLKPRLNEYTFRDKEFAKAAELQKYIDMKIAAYMKQTVPGFSPSNIQETKVMP